MDIILDVRAAPGSVGAFRRALRGMWCDTFLQRTRAEAHGGALVRVGRPRRSVLGQFVAGEPTFQFERRRELGRVGGDRFPRTARRGLIGRDHVRVVESRVRVRLKFRDETHGLVSTPRPFEARGRITPRGIFVFVRSSPGERRLNRRTRRPRHVCGVLRRARWVRKSFRHSETIIRAR